MEKKRPGLGHYTGIRVQRMHEKRNTLPDSLRNYASNSGIPTHRIEIQTAKGTTSVDVWLTAVSLHLLHTRLDNLEKGNQLRNLNPVLNNCILIAL